MRSFGPEELARAWPLILALGVCCFGIGALGGLNLLRYDRPYLFSPRCLGAFSGGFVVALDRGDIHAYSESGRFLWARRVGAFKGLVRFRSDPVGVTTVSAEDQIVRLGASGEIIERLVEPGAYRALQVRRHIRSSSGASIKLDDTEIVVEREGGEREVLVSGPAFPSTQFGGYLLILCGGQGLLALAVGAALLGHSARAGTP